MSDYLALKHLKTLHGYEILQALWQHQMAKIDESLDKAGQRGGDSAMRYWAGQRKGFVLAITALERALVEMEKKAEESQENPAGDYDELIAGLKLPGDKQV
jgi:hypothetical protein